MLPNSLRLNTVLYQKEKRTNLGKLNQTVLFSIWKELYRIEKYSHFVFFTLKISNLILQWTPSVLCLICFVILHLNTLVTFGPLKVTNNQLFLTQFTSHSSLCLPLRFSIYPNTLLSGNAWLFVRVKNQITTLTFAKFRNATVSFVMSCLSVCPSVWNTSAATGRTFMKSDTRVFFEGLEKILVLLRYDKISGYFAWKLVYIWVNISLSSS